MTPDPLVEEVRAIRDEIANEHGYDIDAIFQMLQRLDAASSARHVSLSARPVEGAVVPEPVLDRGAA
jgi:hypothetical protein